MTEPTSSQPRYGSIETPADPGTLANLRIFHDVARALTSSLDLDTILRSIMQQMELFFQPESWSLLMVDPERNDLYYAIAAGQSHGALASIRIPMGGGIAGSVAVSSEPLIVSQGAPPDTFHPDEITPTQVQSVISIPLRSRLRTLGVIQLFNYQLNALTDYTSTFLHILCDYAAIAIENARAVERIQELTITDDCTGLYNARHLNSTLHAEVERSRRFETPLSLVFLDLDHFKHVNDEHGHLVGSRVLAEFANLLRTNLRVVDLAFRYGGDEFIILLPQTPKTAAIEAAQRLVRALRASRFLRAEQLSLTLSASIGIATFPDDADTAEELTRRADEMMYSVKNSSRGMISVAQIGTVAV